MSKLYELLEFYIKDAWKKDEEGNLHPSPELIKDQGKRATAFKHAEPKWKMDKTGVHARLLLLSEETIIAAGTILRAARMPASEHRNMILGSVSEVLQRVEYALRETEETKDADSKH